MKMTADFRNRVLAGEWLAGTWLNLGSALTAEMAGLAGFDWVLLDHEHGPGSELSVPGSGGGQIKIESFSGDVRVRRQGG